MFEALWIKKFMQLLCNTWKSIMYIDCHFDDSVSDTYEILVQICLIYFIWMRVRQRKNLKSSSGTKIFELNMIYPRSIMWMISGNKIARSIEIIIFVGLFNFIILFLINVLSGTSGHFFNWSTCYLLGIRLIE